MSELLLGSSGQEQIIGAEAVELEITAEAVDTRFAALVDILEANETDTEPRLPPSKWGNVTDPGYTGKITY